jgi:hypothetical protein
MPISLVYNGDPQHQEIAEATRLAHAFIQGAEIVTLIEGYEEPLILFLMI